MYYLPLNWCTIGSGSCWKLLKYPLFLIYRVCQRRLYFKFRMQGKSSLSRLQMCWSLWNVLRVWCWMPGQEPCGYLQMSSRIYRRSIPGKDTGWKGPLFLQLTPLQFEIWLDWPCILVDLEECIMFLGASIYWLMLLCSGWRLTCSVNIL